MTKTKVRASGWKQWTADQARQALEAWRESGLSMSGYARRSGVFPQRLRWWRERLGEWESTGRPGASAGELRLVPVITAVEASPVIRAAATLHLPGGAVLEFEPTQVSAAWVAEVAVAAARAR